MWSGELLVVALVAVAVAGTAHALPVPGSDQLDDWFEPFFTCKELQAEEGIAIQNKFHTQLHAMKKHWHILIEHERTQLVNLAERIKPALVKYVQLLCPLFSESKEDKQLDTKEPKPLAKRIGLKLMGNFTIADFYDVEKFPEKMTSPFDTFVDAHTLSADEKTKVMQKFNEILVITQNTMKELKSNVYSLKLEEFVNAINSLYKLFLSFK